MWKRPIAIVCVWLCGIALASPVACGTNTFGFGVGVPPTSPINWNASFTFAATEVLAESNLSFLFTLGTYPAFFPELHEGSASLLVKAWAGPIALYAGGGFSLQWRLIGNAWLWSPSIHLISGAQLWIIDSFAVFTQVRSLEDFSTPWTFDPEVALGVTIAFDRARPTDLRIDGDYFWLLVGLWVIAFLSYSPRS